MKKIISNVDLPRLEEIGLNQNRFKTFFEIARHPDGIAIGQLSSRVGDKSIQVTSNTVRYYEDHSLVKIVREQRNGRSRLICYATAYGAGEVASEMESLCKMFQEIKSEMMRRGSS